MNSRAIVDTGPLVAFLDRSESHHAWVCDKFKTFAVPVLTCEPVLTESLFLLRHLPAGQAKLLELVSRGSLSLPFHLQKEIGSIRDIWRKYEDLPVSLADASLVSMSESTGLPICTFDSHFTIYRKHGRIPLELIRPEHL